MHGSSRVRKRVAAKSVNSLISAALEMVPNDVPLAERHLLRALRLCERYRVRRPILLRRLYCRRCKRPILPGKTSRFRIRRGGRAHLSITCLRCGSVARLPLRPDASRDQAPSGEKVP